MQTDLLPIIYKLPGGQPIQVEEAMPEDYLAIEEMIRHSAMEGRGFGLDEFTKTGVFNRNLLRNSHAVVARLEHGGAPIAATIFGTSAVCRTENKLMGGYIVVSTSHRGSGVGTKLMNTLVVIAKTLGYEGMLMDVYRSESRTISWSKRMGFYVTGSLPDCGYVKDQGYVDSLLLYREFKFDTSKL